MTENGSGKRCDLYLSRTELYNPLNGLFKIQVSDKLLRSGRQKQEV